MSAESHAEHFGKNPRLKAWIIVFLIMSYILIYGLIVFVTVGDKGPADWNYGAVPDAPGESVYTTAPYSTDYLDQ